jgi:hypothetical protein
MKQTIEALTLAFMCVLISSLTLYGALGIDPAQQQQQQQTIGALK